MSAGSMRQWGTYPLLFPVTGSPGPFPPVGGPLPPPISGHPGAGMPVITRVSAAVVPAIVTIIIRIARLIVHRRRSPKYWRTHGDAELELTMVVPRRCQTGNQENGKCDHTKRYNHNLFHLASPSFRSIFFVYELRYRFHPAILDAPSS